MTTVVFHSLRDLVNGCSYPLTHSLCFYHYQEHWRLVLSQMTIAFSCDAHPMLACSVDVLIFSCYQRDILPLFTYIYAPLIAYHFLALIKLQQLVTPPMGKNIQFIFRKSDPSQFRDTLKDIRTRGIYSIIVDTKPDNLQHLLMAVRRFYHATCDKWAYVITQVIRFRLSTTYSFLFSQSVSIYTHCRFCKFKWITTNTTTILQHLI